MENVIPYGIVWHMPNWPNCEFIKQLIDFLLIFYGISNNKYYSKFTNSHTLSLAITKPPWCFVH
jgi:hypothetical protein